MHDSSLELAAETPTTRTSGGKVALTGVPTSLEPELQLVFENELLRRAACANYNLDEANTVSLGKDYARLCRPTESKKAPVAFFFWTMDSPEDNEPTYEKIVITLVYLH